MTFANRVILITGAGSGIGRQLARDLAAEGAAVAAVDVQADALADLARELAGKRLATAVADVTDREALAKAVEQLHQQLGHTDVLFANAGIGFPTPAAEFDAAAFERTVRVNLIGVANSVAAVLPGMIRRQSGHVVGLSSLASLRGIPLMAAYCASKAGLNALMDSLRVELKPRGIVVTTVCPCWVRTPLTDQVTMRMEGLLEVDVAVRLILDAVRRKKALYIFPGPSARRLRLLRWLPTRSADAALARLFRRALSE
jgi:NAD(P)-dependent dehydrogenase (short-subunit alcohol dehydrogenase family)